MFYKGILIMITAVVVSTGCYSIKNNSEIDSDVEKNRSETIANYENEKNRWIAIGKEQKKLEEDPTMNETVITVNGINIIRKSVEIGKIYIKYNVSETTTYSDYINRLIKNTVVKAEAIRLGIIPDQESIDEHINQIKEVLEKGNAEIEGYMKGMEISVEEYLDMNRELAYTNYQRIAFWEYIQETQIDDAKMAEMEEEAKNRNISVSDVFSEYREKYTEELMSKADIEILDPEIKKILENGQ